MRPDDDLRLAASIKAAGRRPMFFMARVNYSWNGMQMLKNLLTG